MHNGLDRSKYGSPIRIACVLSGRYAVCGRFNNSLDLWLIPYMTSPGNRSAKSCSTPGNDVCYNLWSIAAEVERPLNASTPDRSRGLGIKSQPESSERIPRTILTLVKWYLSIILIKQTWITNVPWEFRLIVPSVVLPIEFRVNLIVRFVSSVTKLTGKWGAHIKVVSCAVHHRRFRVIEGPAIPKLNRRTPPPPFISRCQMSIIKSAIVQVWIEGTDVMGLILFNIRFLYIGLNQSFGVYLAIFIVSLLNFVVLIIHYW